MERRHIPMDKVVLILAGGLVFLALYLTSLYSYLLFHSLIEIFTIVVACSIFMLAWNARHLLDNNYLLFVGAAYLFVGIVTIFHMLAYRGMGVFTEYDANLPTQLWIGGQYLHSLSLVIAPLFLTRRLRLPLLIAGYVAITGLLLASIFYWDIFPDCYVEGVGLTSFKKASEYIISLFFMTAVLMLFRYKTSFDDDVWRLLVWAILFLILAELIFSLYLSVDDRVNMTGHMLRFISFFLGYKAIIATGLVKPYTLLFRDLKQSEETLRQYAAELQTRNEELDAFAHTVAHDLKTPLTIMSGFADGLLFYEHSFSQKEKQESLEVIRQTAFKMSNIIDELLLLAQLHQTEVQVEPLEMGAIVTESRQRLGPIISDCQGEIILPPSWPTALGYGPWVEEVWVNYLSNAIKYGSRPPRVELGACPQPDGAVRFWVRDNGPGLTPEQQACLFKPFIQLHQIRVTGHGLGLSIVRRIVEKLGGEVGVESKGIPGQGSLFFFTLPGLPDQQ